MNVKFRQCRMEKSGCQDIVAWLPEKFAIKDKYLKLHFKSGWDNGWLVKSVGVSRLNESHMITLRDQHRNHRSTTDI